MKGFGLLRLALPVLFLAPILAPFWASLARADSAIFENKTAVASLTIAVPTGVNLAGDLRLGNSFSVGLALGGLAGEGGKRTPISIGTTNAELRGRWHSFGGAFFLGLTLGGRSLYARATQSIDAGGGNFVPTQVEMKITSGYATPHIGWLWVFGKGFSLGYEMGAQLPISPKGDLNASISDPDLDSFLSAIEQTQAYRDLENKIEDTGKVFGRIILPHVLIRLGWAF
mgnify:CR=1 FL=1